MSTPSKSFFRMKLSAPEIASEPYTAEAPPVTMSMRSISAVGIIEVSTSPSSLNGTMRLPFMQHQVALRAEAAQVDRRRAFRAVVDVLAVARGRDRQEAQDLLDLRLLLTLDLIPLTE